MACLDRESQLDEMLVLKSIYTDEEFRSWEEGALISGQFDAFVELPTQFFVIYKNLVGSTDENATRKIHLSYLPPVLLRFKLPADYPSSSPPEFKLNCDWLKPSLLKQLSAQLDQLWDQNRGAVVLFIWTNFLKEELLHFLDITDSLEIESKCDRRGSQPSVPAGEQLDQYSKELRKSGRQLRSTDSGVGTLQTSVEPSTKRGVNNNLEVTNIDLRPADLKPNICSNAPSPADTVPPADSCTAVPTKKLQPQPPSLPPPLLDYLIRYDEDRAKTEFGRNLFSCKICFEEKSGLKCIQFMPCKHVYCRECIRGYFEIRINDGDVTLMPCPDDKCKSEATQHQIKELVGPIKFNRYDSLLLSATLSTMSDITYCPRIGCQTPVVRESDEKLATCPACKYAFCVYCRMCYHGIELCKIKDEVKIALIKQYNKGDAEARERLERRYGKRQLINLINSAMSEEWINVNSKQCPSCSSAIEKSDGCNKIVCWKCHSYFCWLCTGALNPNTPYKHFYDPTSKCFNLLFEGVKETMVEVDAHNQGVERGFEGFYDTDEEDFEIFIDEDFDDDEDDDEDEDED